MGIVVSSAKERTNNNGAETELFLIGFYLLNQIFLKAAYSFSFSMRWCNICFTGSLNDFLVG